MTETRSKAQQSEPESGRAKSFDPKAAPAEDMQAHPAASRGRLKQFASRIWQAGLGAALTLESRSSDVFHRLAKKGARYQSLQRRRREQQRVEVVDAAAHADQAHSFRESASERINHLEHSLEASLDRGRDNTLHWIGVPSRKDFEALEKQVDALTHQLAAIQKQLDDRAAASMGSARSRAQR